MTKPAISVHGGAGTILKAAMTGELEAAYRSGLERALAAGWDVISRGGAAIDAVTAAVVELEDCPLFNAGRGSVFTSEGKNEMDACLMDGRDLSTGAVAFVRNVRNPVRLARLVMERTEHCLLAGDGAEQLARELGVPFEPDEYFFTEHRWRQLLEARAEGRIQLDHAGSSISDCGLRIAESEFRIPNSEFQNPHSDTPQSEAPKSEIRNPKPPRGTVGAVACDRFGNVAAATSTGGMTNKKYGRVGDTPIVGAGTYAENATCAVSCTGHGEFFMKGVTAFDVAARMRYRGLALRDAAAETIARLTEIGGEGGFIAVDAAGRVAMPFNSEGMYRGRADERGIETAIY